MHRLHYCSILIFIALFVAIIALINFNKASVINVNGKIPQLNVSKNVNVYTKDFPKSKSVRTTFIIIIALTIVLILHNLFIYKLFRRRIIPSIIGLLLSLAILITSIIGIVYFKSLDLKNVDSLDIKNMLFELNIDINNTNIIIINTLTYLTYGLAIISTLLCGGINIAYFANR